MQNSANTANDLLFKELTPVNFAELPLRDPLTTKPMAEAKPMETSVPKN